MRTAVIIILTTTLPLAAGCRRAAVPTTRPPVASPSLKTAFDRLVHDRGSVTFRSWNGQAIRMDSDTELTFYPDHSVHMFEWGFSLSSYWGVYHVHDDGCVVASFKEFEQEWPVMVVYRDGGTLMLRPWAVDTNFVMGNRGGATIPAGKGSYWPFRMLTGYDEEKVLEMVEEQAGRPPT